MSYREGHQRRSRVKKSFCERVSSLEKKWLKRMWGCSLKSLVSWRKWIGYSTDKINTAQVKQLGGSFKTTGGVCPAIYKLQCSLATVCVLGVYVSSQVIRWSVGEKLAVQLSSQSSSVSSSGHWLLTKNYCRCWSRIIAENCKQEPPLRSISYGPFADNIEKSDRELPFVMWILWHKILRNFQQKKRSYDDPV